MVISIHPLILQTQSAFGNDKNIASFMVTQFQFIGWPEQGRPDTSQGVLQMAESVNTVQRRNPSPSFASE